MRKYIVVIAIWFVGIFANGAHAETTSETFRQPWLIGAYSMGWAGSYDALGVGGKIGWRPFAHFGIETFGEALAVKNVGGFRHDHPIGFNLYTPIGLGSHVELRPLFGMCAVFSFIEPTRQSAPRADDILLGVHAGAALDVALSRLFSLFIEGQGTLYMGHERYSQAWSGSVDGRMKAFTLVQISAGMEFHFPS